MPKRSGASGTQEAAAAKKREIEAKTTSPAPVPAKSGRGGQKLLRDAPKEVLLGHTDTTGSGEGTEPKAPLQGATAAKPVLAYPAAQTAAPPPVPGAGAKSLREWPHKAGADESDADGVLFSEVGEDRDGTTIDDDTFSAPPKSDANDEPTRNRIDESRKQLEAS